jgi:hypothetical protein
MSAKPVQTISSTEATTEARAEPSHVALYWWIYAIFIILSAVALYVIFTVPQGEI